uniref:Lysine demethylase 7A n=1 Tax=Myripristis murdjan TaxID=586833 RepID=A0A668ARW4_9TELE
MAAAPLYCVCRQPYDVSRFMIECDICKDWFHGSCVQVEEHHAVDIDVYHCPNCDVVHGPSLMKKRNNWHRHDYTEPDDGTKPVQAGTPVFIKELQNRTFASGEEILMRMKGEQVTPRYLERHGFSYPIAVTEMEGLGLKLPPTTFSVKDVEQYVGGDKIIDVIDVARQADSKMKLSEFVKYFCKPHRPKVLNLISLEFSDTKMSELVVVPDVAQKMSWVENYWPDDSFFPKPFVQKYCLMGVKDSYTDFHIDFGGTSVWYHVLWGEKIFYLIKPTPANLALYEAWSSSPNQSEVFFGNKVDKCYKCVVPQGTTLLIPTGWIHAVLTSQDCMAFGGNFLHNLNIGMQLRCYEMERRLKTPDLFKFPYFEAICWYVAKNLLETLKGESHIIICFYLLLSVTEPTSEVPDHIRPNHLIKELTKEIRYLEVRTGLKDSSSVIGLVAAFVFYMSFLCASCRERPTSPSTEEAIQGMLSMAGLLCPSKPEKGASSQEPWWSSPGQRSPPEPREPAQHQRRLQGDKSPMDSQGNSSSEAWDNQGLPSPLNRCHNTSPETDYQYCDPSMSPPLHPSKRHAPNPPPISNQATKGLEFFFFFYLIHSCFFYFTF